MRLTEKQITELKEKVDFIKMETEGKSLSDVFKIANRSTYETSLLFFKAYDYLRNIEYGPLTKILEEAKKIGTQYNYFNDILKYPDYKSCGMGTFLEGRMISRLQENREFIFDFINLVFGRLISEENEKEDDIFKQIKEVKDDKKK